jgi:hypothetical protein
VILSASYRYVPSGMGSRPEQEGFSRRNDDFDRADDISAKLRS